MCRLIYLVIFSTFLLMGLPGEVYCAETNSKLEIEWDHLTPRENDRKLDTVSLHILKKISETKNRSVYRGITITQPQGDVIFKGETKESSAIGVGPVYMVRNEKYHFGKLSGAVEMSGGFILYNKKFPAGGRYFNFMWRIGPQIIYKPSENSSVNLGYMLMHVSNGFKTDNPSYNAHGVSLSFTTNF